MSNIRQLPRPQRITIPRAASLLLLTLTCVLVSAAQATELIPWVGVSRPARAVDNRVDYFAGLSLRADMFAHLQSEIGAAVRREPLPDGVVRWVWPLTASLWLSPHPSFYGGGGVGWYHTTLYDGGAQTAQTVETTEKFGMHAGGGVRVPLGPRAALDLGGRYVFMTRKELTTSRFGPDFWLTSLGLAIRF